MKQHLTAFILVFFSFLFFKSSAQTPYTTVKINNVDWCTENLSVSKFLNGEPIPIAKSKSDWIKAALAKKPICEIEKSNNKVEYRYNYYVFLDKRGVLPNGFRLPTEADFDNLGTSLTENPLLIPKLKLKPVGTYFFNRNDSTFNFDATTAAFWVYDNSSIEMEREYNIGTSKVRFIRAECIDKFPATCEGGYVNFETLYESGFSDAGNGSSVRLIKKK
jgi:uncharacterized protein (TIGR02145 family)